MKKLKAPEEGAARMLARFRVLGPALGPVLFQLPPKWRANAERLEAFLAVLPADVRAVFEFRDDSWFSGEILELLRRQGAALCVSDHPDSTVVTEPTADWVYVRLHGAELYAGNYDGRTLRGWAKRIAGWADQGCDVWCFFDNDIKAAAPDDAERLKRMVADETG